MKNKLFNFKNSIKNLDFDKNEIKKISTNFESIFRKIEKQKNIDNSIYNLIKKKILFSYKENKLRSFKSFNKIALIGMGGSILGSKAIYNFLKKKINKKVFFFDNIDLNKISKFKKINDIDKVLFLIISKSGNTVETISNALFLDIFKKNKNNVIIITEKKNNILYSLSEKLNLFHVEHKDFIGGRFSVLSEVGMLPAFLMGLKTQNFRYNYKNFLQRNKKILKDSVVKLAYSLTNKKFTNLILINYSPELEELLYWYQQLIAESLGKKGKGFLPMISNTPKDHHSLLQLYLDGPKNKIFYVFSLNENSNKKIKTKGLSSKANFLNKKSLPEIKNAQKKAFVKCLDRQNIPFRELNINKIDEATLGELFAYFIIETIILGKISGINPFDQPAVEKVKILTKKFLN